eukprot:Gb_38055 [translate_table: standard]
MDVLDAGAKDGYGPEEFGGLGEGWYFSREDIEKFAPSRKDGIDSKKEAYLRKSYCKFLKDIGKQLKLLNLNLHQHCSSPLGLNLMTYLDMQRGFLGSNLYESA